MLDYERFDLRFAIAQAEMLSGITHNDRDILCDSDFWHLYIKSPRYTLNYGLFNTPQGLVQLENQFQLLDQIETERSQRLHRGTKVVVPATICTPLMGPVPNYNLSDPRYLYVAEQPQLPPISVGADSITVLRSANTSTTHDLLRQIQILIAQNFGSDISWVQSKLNHAFVSNPNVLLYALCDEWGLLSTATVINDGTFRSIWNVATDSGVQMRGLATQTLAYAIKDSAKRCETNSPIYLHSAEQEARLYQKLGFQNVRKYNVWTRITETANDQI